MLHPVYMVLVLHYLGKRLAKREKRNRLKEMGAS